MGQSALIMCALFANTVAALTGILAVGSGKHWSFNVVDYLRGRRNAIIYLWVILSSIGSILHSGMLIEYGIRNEWTFQEPGHLISSIIYLLIGIVLTIAHVLVTAFLSRDVEPADKYFWGNKDNNV